MNAGDQRGKQMRSITYLIAFVALASPALEPIRELMTHDEWVTALRLSMMRIMASFTNATAMRVWHS